MNNKVKFLRGTSNEYTVAEKDSDTIYFTTDDGKLYIGDKEILGESIKAFNSHINDSVKHITSTERTNWNAAKTHADSAHAPSNAQANVIETVKVNGTALTPSSKAVDITVPSYSIMTGATSSASGTSGLVPAPASGNQSSYLRGDGTWAVPTNTDTKVTNTLNTTAKAYVTGTTSSSTNTGTQVFDTGVYLDTTAGMLTATTFKGALSGNATSASKLATARTIALTGDITGSSSFDGSGNINIGTTISNKDVVKTIKLGTDVYKAVNNVATIKAVSVSANQSLTQAEKVNARNNIDVDGARQLTYAEYKSLSAAEQNNGTTYYITDANFTGDNVIVVSPPTSVSSIMSKVATNPSNSKKIRIKLVGDSITEGAKGSNADKKGPLIVTSNITKAGVVVDDGAVGLSTSQWNINVGGHCWANELKKYLEKKYNCEVINYGCGGFSSYNVVNHLTDLIEDNDDIIIIMIGTNDRISVDPLHGKPTSIETYITNIQTIYNYCKRYNKKVIFMANIPASARNEGIAGTIPTSSNDVVQYNSINDFPAPSATIAESKKAYYDKSTGLYYRCVASGSTYMFAEVRHFHMEDVDTALMAFAYRNNIEYISVFKLFSQYCRMTNTRVEDLLADNLHPNDEGYDIMFYLITNALGISSQIPGATW